MPIDNWPIKNVAAQTLLVAIISVICTVVSEGFTYRGYINLIVLFTVVSVVSFYSNVTWAKKAFMFVVLSIIYFLMIGAVGYFLGYAD
jgi:hypothetical protein